MLPAPLEPAFADQIGAAEMVRIVEIAAHASARFVVVDTPAYFNDVVLGLIEISDDVLLVAGMDIPNIKNVKIGLQTLRLLNTPMEKLRLVLNRANSKVKLDVGEVERTLRVKADALIPSDVVVPAVGQQGRARRADRTEVERVQGARGAWPTCSLRPRARRETSLALASKPIPGGHESEESQCRCTSASTTSKRRRPRAPTSVATRSSTSCARRSTTT